MMSESITLYYFKQFMQTPSTSTDLFERYSIGIGLNLSQWNIDQRQIFGAVILQCFSLLNLNGCIEQTATMINSNHLETHTYKAFV